MGPRFRRTTPADWSASERKTQTQTPIARPGVSVPFPAGGKPRRGGHSAVKAAGGRSRIFRWDCAWAEKEGAWGSLFRSPFETVAKAYVIGREAAQFAMKLA